MVNGGGTLMLEFSKSRLKTRFVSVNAIWNQFVYIDPIVMYLDEDSISLTTKTSLCQENTHNSSITFPKIHTSWKEIRANYYDKSTMILVDSGVVKN